MLTLTVGVPFTMTADEAGAASGRTKKYSYLEWIFDKAGSINLPPGVTLPGWNGGTMEGTPTTAGEYSVMLGLDDEGSAVDSKPLPITVQAAAPEPDPEPEPIPDAEGVSLTVGDAFNRTADEVAASIGLSNGVGAVYEFDTVVSTPPAGTVLEWNRISGTVTTPGEYNLRVFFASDGVLHQQTNYRVRVLEPVELEPDPDPDPDPEPDPVDAAAARIAERAVRFIGRDLERPDGSPTAHLETARVQAPIVLAFTAGYTRGHGFTEGAPAADVEAVVVSALSRLVQNPEQVSYFQSGDYSEKGAVLVGFTLMERYVLNRYRKVWA